MRDSGEPFTLYGLMFGVPIDCTLGEVDQAIRRVSTESLIGVAGLGVTVGTAFDLAFGTGDPRTVAVASVTFGPVATELDGRGLRFPLMEHEIEAAFALWCQAMLAGGAEVETIPTYRLKTMRAWLTEALSRFDSEVDSRVTTLVQQALATVDDLLKGRGILQGEEFSYDLMPDFDLLVPYDERQRTAAHQKGSPNSTGKPVSVQPQRLPLPHASVVQRSQDQNYIRIFIAYSHKDERFRDGLVTHLSPLKRLGKVSEWFDRKIVAGETWEEIIDSHLENSQIVLLLISPDFIASDYCYGKEMKCALERHENGDAVVVPIVVRAVDWQGQPFAKLQMLPTDARPIANWSNRDNAWVNVIAGIKSAMERLRNTS